MELQDPHRKGFSIAIDSHILSLTHYERNVSLWVSHSELIFEFWTDLYRSEFVILLKLGWNDVVTYISNCQLNLSLWPDFVIPYWIDDPNFWAK